METIRELLSRLTTLTSDELTELRTQIIAEGERLDGEDATPENVQLLNELVTATDQIMAEAQNRETAQAEAEQAKTAARDRIAALRGESETTDEETPAEETPEAGAESETEEVPAEAVTAAGSVARMAARAPKASRSPEATQARNRAVLTATGALEVRDQTKPIEGRYELAEGMARTLKRMNRDSAPRGTVLVASATWEYPEERKLGGDAWENTRRIEAVTHPSALVATGGICAPTNVDYDVPTWSTADRPLRDALPAFEASRGGVSYVQPPDIGALAGASGLWTEATDASPGSATKNVLQVVCGTPEQVYVDAVTMRLQFGNMQSRFAPEQVAANTDLAIAYAARFAENNLLNKIAASCVAGVTSAAVLGATRDLITVINQAVAGYRSLHRIPRTQVLTAIFPDWVKELVRVDLAREIAHGQNADWNSLMITDQQIEDLFKAQGVNPVWHIDGQPSGVAGGVAQVFGAQSASGAINTFPGKVVWYLFAEGTMQFLDGGRLDLGVVRDATLDATNDYETFVETFEGIAFRGFSSGAIQYVSTLCANGTTSGTTAVGSCA